MFSLLTIFQPLLFTRLVRLMANVVGTLVKSKWLDFFKALTLYFYSLIFFLQPSIVKFSCWMLSLPWFFSFFLFFSNQKCPMFRPRSKRGHWKPNDQDSPRSDTMKPNITSKMVSPHLVDSFIYYLSRRRKSRRAFFMSEQNVSSQGEL